MVKINNIELNNFRNFTKLNIDFDNKINIFFGNNGCGKTNLLEGISLLAKGRGLRNANISHLIKNKKENFLIKNKLEIKKNNFDIKIYNEKKNDKFKKIIKVNDDLSKESLDILNQSISYLTFVPEMERLFQASPSYRRNFIDRLIFSSKNNYNKIINSYKKYLLERIKILQKEIIDYDWLSHIEKEISIIGLEIYESRLSTLKSINKNLSNLNNEKKFLYNVKLNLKDTFIDSDLNIETYQEYLKNSRYLDKQYGGTKIGPHRSDIIAEINKDFEASLLSTGQQKTVVLMILLAQCNYLVNSEKITPILLLDEISSHLDENNREILLEMVNRFNIQFFLTGTEKNLFSFVSTNSTFYNINDL